MMTAVDLVSLPSHLVGQCSDMHIRMMHIQHPAKQQQDLESFFKLREEESFCDMTFITGGKFSNDKSERRCIKVHSLVIAASSDFLKSWMETTFVADLKYEVVLPDTDHTNLETLINILYGVDVAVPQHKLDQLHSLADMLGITVDLPFRIIEQSFSGGGTADGANGEHQVNNLITLSVGGEKQAEFTDLEDENAGVDVLPLCCWHCNRAFADLEELKDHVKTHKGERFKSKRHKCQKCKKILPSMWKLRQHLLTHASSMPKRRYGAGPAADHVYATSEKQHEPNQYEATKVQQKEATKDHPYATMDASKQFINIGRGNFQNDPVDTPPLSLVSSEHSYGTRLKTTQDDTINAEMMGGSNSRDRRYDHPYSAWDSHNPSSRTSSLQPLTPKKLRVRRLPDTKNKIISTTKSDKDLRKCKRKGGENPKTMPKRHKRTERIQNSAEAMKGSEEMKSSNLAEIDHQYASNQSNMVYSSHKSKIRQQATKESEGSSKHQTRSPSPPRGAAKRKASLNLQRLRDKVNKITTNNECKKYAKFQNEISKDATPSGLGNSIESIQSIVELSKYKVQQETNTDSQLVVRLHPLKTQFTANISSPIASTVVSKLPIPALHNSRTRAGSKKGKSIETNFPCNQCTKAFPQKYRRARHVREVHDKEKRHQCGMCEKSFFKITSKERHELTHLKNRMTQWSCSLCSKNFSDENSLSYHTKNKVCVRRGISKP